MLPEPQKSNTYLNNSRLQILHMDDIDLDFLLIVEKTNDREGFRACSALQWGRVRGEGGVRSRARLLIQDETN